MILYFTGTGNSLYAARKIAEKTRDRMMDISQMVHKGEYHVELGENENLGFIFPVYFYGVPTIIRYFISYMSVSGNENPYTYAVLTCGGSIGGAGVMLERVFEKNCYTLDRVFTLLMPDNYVLMFNPPTKEKAASILHISDQLIEDITDDILERKKEKITAGLGARALTRTAYSLYIRGRKTKGFYAEDSCTGCGKCAANCPIRAIVIREGKPEWVKEQCVYCLRCINCCPEEAIQYGLATKRRRRYQNK